jgi:hypothetical protein
MLQSKPGGLQRLGLTDVHNADIKTLLFLTTSFLHTIKTRERI